MALPHIPQHAEYQEHLRQSLLHQHGISSSALQALEDLIHFFCLCDLDPVIRFLSKFYSPLIGRTAFDPTAMFRALLLITQMPVKSFHDIPKFLAANPVYTILCGFDPDKLPAPQTFRDFLDRLASLRKSLKAKRVRKVKTSRAERKKKKSQQGEKSPERPGLVEKLLARLEKGKPIPLVPPVELLNELLAAGFARRSVDAGLLGNPNSLNVAGDGMPFTIHADGSGKKTCSCPHGQPCNHHRRFSSPDADWGRDSSRNAWFYGCHFYELTAKGVEEATLYLVAAQASVHDSAPGFLTIYGASLLYTEYHFGQCILDSAHDNHPTYRLLLKQNISPIIDLNLRKAKNNPLANKELRLDAQGRPICLAGHPMVHRGRIGSHIRFDCPATRKRLKIICDRDCHVKCRCLRQDADIRLLTSPQRGSSEWKEAYKNRTCVERSHDRKKNDFRLKDIRLRSIHRLFPLYLVGACAQHVRIWMKHDNFSLDAFLHPETLQAA